MTAVGIDLGASRFHVAVLGERIEVQVTSELRDVLDLCAGASAVAIDAPSEPATGRVHAGARSPKFAVARCNEIAAGEELGVWVPWVTPILDDCPAWMRNGFRVWEALRSAGRSGARSNRRGTPPSVGGRRWPPRKTTASGRATRRTLLEPLAGPLVLDDHDALDAVMAAVVARGPHRAVRHTDPGCDGSSLFVLA